MPSIQYRNPVYPHYFADPFVWKGKDEFYAIGTGLNEDRGNLGGIDEPSVFPLLRSANLVDWRDAGRALIPPAATFGDTFWAPEVASDGTRWYLFYSVGHADRLHQIRVAISEMPLGPYVDVIGLTNLEECSFAIDPHPFRDDDGRWYLFFARDFLTTEDHEGISVRAGTALVVQPMLSMTELSGQQRTVARARCDWQRYEDNRMMYGQRFDWHTLEGPFVVKERGRYYCLFSGGCWQTETYGVDYVVADVVFGPYSDAGVERGPRVLKTVRNGAIGPGHCSVVVGPDGETRYIVYHAWDAERTARRMCIDELRFSRDGPRCDGPSSAAQQIRIGPG
jgi:beta-xylosidase